MAAPPPSALLKSTLESQPSCQRFVRFDDKYLFLGFGANSGEGAGHKIPPLEVRMVSLADRSVQRLDLDDAAVDAARVDSTLWVLTSSALEEWDITRMARVKSYVTYNIGNREFDYQENPTGMVLYKDLLVISHGRLGYSIFDTTKKSLVFQTKLIPNQAPMESMATGVTISGNKAYFILDNFTLSYPNQPVAFRGFVVVNLDSNKIESQLDGMDPGSDATISNGNTLIVSFWGQPVWKYALNTLAGKKLPEPLARIASFSIPGHPIGTPSMDDQYYYTCYEKMDLSQPGGKATLVPMAMDRKVFHLD